MKRFCFILFFATCTAMATPAQVVQTVAARQSVSLTPKAAGDTLLVECDASTAPSGNVTDSAGTVYTAIGKTNVSGVFAQMVAISAPLASTAANKITCPVPSNGEIYVVELAGAAAVDGAAGLIQTNGSSASASGTLPTSAGDIVLAFCITGVCSPGAGWTTLSAFDSNLVAMQTAAGANVAGSFPASSNWVLTLVALKPSAAVPSPPPSPPPPATVVASFACTPAFLPVTFSTFVPSGAKGLTFSVLNSDAMSGLVISQITPPPGFLIDATPALPLTIAPGDSQTFTIRFVPTGPGTYAGNVIFLANVAGGNFQMGVSGIAK